MNAAEVWIALTDGGNGQEEFIRANFPRAVTILDFHHATLHLSTFLKTFRTGTQTDRLLASWCHILKKAGGQQMIKVPERLPRCRSWLAITITRAG